MVPDGSLLKTAEYQLLLSSIALPGVFLGAYLCDILGRKNTMMLGFSGYCTFSSLRSTLLADIRSGIWPHHWLRLRQDHEYYPTIRRFLWLDAVFRQPWSR